MDTIFALASAPGKAGVSVLRISGDLALVALERLTGHSAVPPDRKLLWLKSADGDLIDQALCLSFAKGHSFTGELTVELQVHGSMAVVSAVLAALADMPGLRQADPGEFTRRALENDRLDLTQVEGLADLIDAETEAQRRQAQRVFSGHFGQVIAGWRTDLIRAAALIEATIDFADEDVPTNVYPEVTALIQGVLVALEAQVKGARAAERVRDGFEVAIIGPPNAGKSTLLNRLAGRDAALTSDIAGTTRDIVEVRMDVDGVPVTFLDTAGLRDTQDTVEAMGVALARSRAADADLRVFLKQVGDDPSLSVELDADDLVVWAKDDAGVADGRSVSGKTGQGVDALLQDISARLVGRVRGAGLAIRARHVAAMRGAESALSSALQLIATDPGHAELIAADLRSATRKLDSIIGYVDVEDLLDEIFASFCLGK